MNPPPLCLVVDQPAPLVVPSGDAALLAILDRVRTLDTRAAEMVEECRDLPLGDPLWLRAKALAVHMLPMMERAGRHAAAIHAETSAGQRGKAELVLLLADESEAVAGALGVSLAGDMVVAR